jgi:hypothetical protein
VKYHQLVAWYSKEHQCKKDPHQRRGRTWKRKQRKKKRLNGDIKRYITCKRWREEEEKAKKKESPEEEQAAKSKEEEEMGEKKVEEEAPNMRDLVKDLVGRLKARWTEMRDSTKIGEMLEKVGDWKDAEISIHMLGWKHWKKWHTAATSPRLERAQ